MPSRAGLRVRHCLPAALALAALALAALACGHHHPPPPRGPVARDERPAGRAWPMVAFDDAQALPLTAEYLGRRQEAERFAQGFVWSAEPRLEQAPSTLGLFGAIGERPFPIARLELWHKRGEFGLRAATGGACECLGPEIVVRGQLAVGTFRHNFTVTVEPNAEGSRADGSRGDGSRGDRSRGDRSGTEGSRTDASRDDAARAEHSRDDAARADGSRAEGSRAEGARTDGASSGPVARERGGRSTFQLPRGGVESDRVPFTTTTTTQTNSQVVLEITEITPRLGSEPSKARGRFVITQQALTPYPQVWAAGRFEDVPVIEFPH